MSETVPLLEVAPVTFVAALVVTPLVRRLARGTGYVDQPAARKAHAEPTPLLGGLAVASALVAGPLLAQALTGATIEPPRAGAVVGAAIAFFLGLLDDRLPLGPRGKLAGQLLASACLVWWGTEVALIRQNPFLGVLAVVGVASLLNAVNFLDNMDGILGALVPVIAGGFVALALVHGAPVSLTLAWGLIGACTGFLVYNAPPARIFLGDAGSHLLGYSLAFLAFQSVERALTWGRFAAVLAILAYPTFDAVFVIFDRFAGGRPIHVGGTDHTTHRLGRLLGRWWTLAIVTFAATISGATGVWIWGREDALSTVGAITILALGYAIFGVMLRRGSPTPPFDT